MFGRRRQPRSMHQQLLPLPLHGGVERKVCLDVIAASTAYERPQHRRKRGHRSSCSGGGGIIKWCLYFQFCDVTSSGVVLHRTVLLVVYLRCDGCGNRHWSRRVWRWLRTVDV